MFLKGLLGPKINPDPFLFAFLGRPLFLTPFPCTFLLAKPNIASVAPARAKLGNSFFNNVGAINFTRFVNQARNPPCLATCVFDSFRLTPVFLFLANVTFYTGL